MRGQRKVGVAPQAQPLGVGLHQVDGRIDPRSRPLVTGGIARTVDQVEHLLGVGQRHDQRRVTPHAFVGDVHARLLLAVCRRHRAIHIDVGHRAQQIPGPGAPQLGSHRVNALHQLAHVLLVETSREVTRRGRVRNQVGVQSVHVGRVVPQALDVLQPRATAQHVVGQVQYVIRLMIRQMHFQQFQRRVDRLGEAQLRYQAVDGRDAAVAHRVRVRTDLVVHPTRAKHRLRLRPPVSRQAVARRYLASPPCGVPAALLHRYCLHRKDLLRWGSEFCPNLANSNNGKSFRSLRRTEKSPQSRLVRD